MWKLPSECIWRITFNFLSLKEYCGVECYNLRSIQDLLAFAFLPYIYILSFILYVYVYYQPFHYYFQEAHVF